MFSSESALETYLRRIIHDYITTLDPRIYALDNKDIVDIVICKDGANPALYFIETKLYQPSHSRIHLGSNGGSGFQPEILTRSPDYLERKLRWVIGAKGESGVVFVPNRTIRTYASGGSIGNKHNNLQRKILDEQPRLSMDELGLKLQSWLRVRSV